MGEQTVSATGKNEELMLLKCKFLPINSDPISDPGLYIPNTYWTLPFETRNANGKHCCVSFKGKIRAQYMSTTARYGPVILDLDVETTR